MDSEEKTVPLIAGNAEELITGWEGQQQQRCSKCQSLAQTGTLVAPGWAGKRIPQLRQSGGRISFEGSSEFKASAWATVPAWYGITARHMGRHVGACGRAREDIWNLQAQTQEASFLRRGWRLHWIRLWNFPECTPPQHPQSRLSNQIQYINLKQSWSLALPQLSPLSSE